MSSLMEKKEVTFLPLMTPALASIHPAWQMAATTLPCWAASRTSFTIASCRRIMSGAYPPGTITGRGPLITTPFSSIQVQAWVHEGKLVDVKTLHLTGSDDHTNALNRRAEPILRREALEAGGAEIDVVSGATYTSESWKGSLMAAIEAATVD